MAQITDSQLQYKSQLQKTEWTFLDVSTKKYTHGIHLYPARMHPEIAKRVIEKYAKNKTDVVFDPFMGSGGVLLEAIINGNQAIGIDINPFAVLLSKVKTTPIHKDLNQVLKKILSNSIKDHQNKKYYPDQLPKKLDVETWYSPNIIEILTILKHNIFNIGDEDIQNFFKICLSLTIRKSSYQRNGAWKIHRISESDRKTFDPKPIDIFRQIAEGNIAKMIDLVNVMPKGKSHILLGDSRNITDNFSKINDDILEDKKAHLVVTSPPYGDHKTTVAYGQFSKHSSLWLELPEEQTLVVDSVGLGGKCVTGNDLESDTLNTTLDKVRKNDIELTKNKKPCRTEAVYSFFYDLDKCLNEISKNLVSKKSHCCFVVANRTVRRVVIPTDLITIELSKKHGFKIDKIIQRDIPNKAMPSKNAPENISQKTGNTMTRESVIIMKYWSGFMKKYDELLRDLKKIKESGFQKTHRVGNTGIGKTLEDLLGIEENNVAGPNGHQTELKSSRKNTTSMVTLFTLSPKPRRINSKLLEKFGRDSDKGSKQLHTTINAITRNTVYSKTGFKINISDLRVEIDHPNYGGIDTPYWDKTTLEKAFYRKYPQNLLYVKADFKNKGKNEEFHFNEAWLMSGFSFDNFIELLSKKKILVDIRMGQYPNGKPHDHGTGFRISPDDLVYCFTNRNKVMW